jgi:SnoaL-like polyketide cyclase
MGPPATGREVSVLAADFGVVRDGRFVERWGFLDQAGLMRQLGLAPGGPGGGWAPPDAPGTCPGGRARSPDDAGPPHPALLVRGVREPTSSEPARERRCEITHSG